MPKMRGRATARKQGRTNLFFWLLSGEQDGPQESEQRIEQEHGAVVLELFLAQAISHAPLNFNRYSKLQRCAIAARNHNPTQSPDRNLALAKHSRYDRFTVSPYLAVARLS
jgi:hypothetical protein